jgi:predicted ribosome quality control (RQC) complex YloA/Tae2 family protein
LYKNYFTYRRIILALDPIFTGTAIHRCYSQEKNVLTIETDSDAGYNALKICVGGSYPFIIAENSQQKKADSVALFPELSGEGIRGIFIHPGERIVTIETENFKLIIVLFSELANMYCYKDEILIKTFKKHHADSSRLMKLLNEGRSYEDLLPFVAKKYAYQGTRSALAETLLAPKKFYIYQQEDSRFRLRFWPEDTSGKCFVYDAAEVLTLGRDIVYKFLLQQQLHSEWHDFVKQTKDKITYYQNTLNKLLEIKPDPRQKEAYQQMGDLIMIHFNQIEPESRKLRVKNIFVDGEPEVVIDLKPHLSPDENARHYYRKVRQYDDNAIAIERRKQRAMERVAHWQAQLALIATAESVQERRKLLRKNERSSVGMQQDKADKWLGFRHWESDDGWHIYVGKTDAKNDELTFKIGKNNDLWLHAKGVPGSHVLILNREKNKVVPKPIVHQAAAFAAYYSKAKNARKVPVIVTEVRHVYKPKGAKPGSVVCKREKVIFANPEELI